MKKFSLICGVLAAIVLSIPLHGIAKAYATYATYGDKYLQVHGKDMIIALFIGSWLTVMFLYTDRLGNKKF